MTGTTFAYRFRRARLDLKLSQTVLAIKAGFHPSAISHFETGEREPSIANLVKLADVLGVNTDFLLGRFVPMVNAGSAADVLISQFKKMSHADREAYLEFGKMLAGKSKGKRA